MFFWINLTELKTLIDLPSLDTGALLRRTSAISKVHLVELSVLAASGVDDVSRSRLF